MKDNLWADNQSDDLEATTTHHPRPPSTNARRHIGCPLSWFKLVFPIVRGKNELAVALHIYRLRMVRRSRTVTISNGGLLAELGIDRFAKYRALRRLADAGVIKVKRHNRRAIEVTFSQKYSARKL
jgi:hypothetical protein